MKKYLAVFLLIFGSFLSLPTWASEIFGKISYKGAPLKNAQITVQGKTTQTNDLGFYSINLDPGSYVFTIQLPGGESRDQKIAVFPQPTEKNLKLE